MKKNNSLGSRRISRRDWMVGFPFLLAGCSAAVSEFSLFREPIDRNPQIAFCHLGYLPQAKKRIVIRAREVPREVVTLFASGKQVRQQRPSQPASSDFGSAIIFDITDVKTPGLYEVQYGKEKSPVFSIGDVWRPVLPVLVGYHRFQRCGSAVPNVHSPCHLDDARRRDTGEHVDTTGGWHDAGDTRKWVDATLMNLFGLLSIERILGNNWNVSSGVAPLLEEARYGNDYFLKMQDVDGLVWSDVGGGVNGDNSDNRWTDGRAGTADDRWINVVKRPGVQAMFIAGQAMMYQAIHGKDDPYAARCLDAAKRCWMASRQTLANTVDLAWRLLAGIEMTSAAGDSYIDEAVALANRLADQQFTSPAFGQNAVVGFFRMWPGNDEPFRDVVHSATPAYALLRAAEQLRDHNDSHRWSSAVRLYLDGYVIPMVNRSAYRIMPFGVFKGNPPGERYRPLAGELTYRFFMPVKGKPEWLGLSSHLLSHALLLATASQHFDRSEYRDLAYSQLEWVLGSNPFGASLVTGLGHRNPPPYSPFVGPIPGGIMNGICGNAEDEPILDQVTSQTYQSGEYWSPHVGYCEWLLTVLATI
jgi:hypothetical protein